MKHIRALTIKFIATLAVLFVILGLGFGVEFQNVFVLSLIIGLVAYPLGDLMLLPRTNNITASISDLALAFMISWFYLSALADRGFSLFLASLFSAIGITLSEYFFHKYIASSDILDDEEIDIGDRRLQYQAETSEEISPEIKKDKEE